MSEWRTKIMMLRFIVKRVLLIIPIMLGVMLIIFTLRAVTPGDPVTNLLGEHATQEQIETKRAELGLDQPLPIQFAIYVKDVFTGDLGTSYTTKEPVLNELLKRLPVSLVVTFGAVMIGMCIGIPLGTISALKQYSWLDSVVLVISMIAAATPSFVLALIMISIFSIGLQWLPAVGLASGLGFILPMTTIGLNSLSQYTRITRSSMLEVIRQDYIRTARAKGQSESTITRGHAIRNALIPVVTSAGNQIGHQLGGALIVETVFGIPGVGKYIGDAIITRNYPAIQGGVLLLAFMFTLVNLLVDLSFIAINPRLKTSIMFRKKRKTLIGKWLKNRRAAMQAAS